MQKMNGAEDIGWVDLGIGYFLLIIPLFILYYYQTGLVKTTIFAVFRMTLQLLLVGVYLEYIFKINNKWINLVWVVAMILIAAFTAVKRSKKRFNFFFFPVLLAIVISILGVDYYILKIVLKLDNIVDARYFVPITGMIIGNCMSTIIMAFNTYFEKLKREQTQYRFALANGATRSEALKPFIRKALIAALNPTIATTSVVGLISLPGMMTGQILGGSDPSVAIKYQMVIMISIIVASCTCVLLSIIFSERFIFDSYDNVLDVEKKN